MRTIAHLNLLRSDIGDVLYEELKSLHPTLIAPGGLFYTLPTDEPGFRSLMSRLEAAGFRPNATPHGPRCAPQEFAMHLVREYEPDDLTRFELLELHPRADTRAHGPQVRNDSGSLIIEKHPSCDIAIVNAWAQCIVHQRGRNILESQTFRGLSFRPVEKTYESLDYNLYDEDDTWWELVADVVLPSLSSSMSLVTRVGTPYQGKSDDGCLRVDGLFQFPELKYDRSAIEALGGFDVAMTSERFGHHPNSDSGAIVVSKRFYEICSQHELQTAVLPVHLDDPKR